ncbi:MAG TPA: carboxypeptidase-like regulatory domain-containing protein, partial [Candidatus Polarisedimenticolia bacterium]|nr:carboxypeptidase-like regulatory domain-containing protein [Candidatus Polarisedimenticolia bacterium]
MRHWKVFLGLTLILAFADYVPAQTGLTSLRGTVTDPAGAVVPGAQVELKNNATGSHATATTDSNGAYEFPQIPPGRYTLTATMTGFAVQTKEAELLVSQPATINFALSVQESRMTIEVSTEAQTINMTDATIGNSVSNTTVQALP